MNFDEEINNILNNIKEHEYDSLEDIEEIRQMAIDKVFGSFMRYEANIKNKQRAEEELKSYEFIDINDLQRGDYVRYFNLRCFYDLRLVIGGTVLEILEDGDIVINTPYSLKTIKPNIFFKRIKSDDLIKMKLIQIANKI
jgi:hypothetical protein